MLEGGALGAVLCIWKIEEVFADQSVPKMVLASGDLLMSVTCACFVLYVFSVFS